MKGVFGGGGCVGGVCVGVGVGGHGEHEGLGMK